MGFNFDCKTFHLIQNSEKGAVSSDTTFAFRQKGDLVTADYSGGNIEFGKIIARLEGNNLFMLYQCLTTKKELKAGKAKANVSYDNNQKIKLDLKWEWIHGGDGNGNSEYLEQ